MGLLFQQSSSLHGKVSCGFGTSERDICIGCYFVRFVGREQADRQEKPLNYQNSKRVFAWEMNFSST